MDRGALDFFKTAEQYVKTNFNNELLNVEHRRFENQNTDDFLRQYIYVVLNSGMKNQVAKKVFQRFLDSGFDLNIIGHPSKKKAIAQAILRYKGWFEKLKASNDKIRYLDTLPWIGEITKYHLARNLGIDCAKPDRHLVILAKYFGYPSVQQMCEDISKESGYRVGTVDAILWRYCNMHHPIVNSLFHHPTS
jgi:hypothetical protein